MSLWLNLTFDSCFLCNVCDLSTATIILTFKLSGTIKKKSLQFFYCIFLYKTFKQCKYLLNVQILYIGIHRES